MKLLCNYLILVKLMCVNFNLIMFYYTELIDLIKIDDSWDEKDYEL